MCEVVALQPYKMLKISLTKAFFQYFPQKYQFTLYFVCLFWNITLTKNSFIVVRFPSIFCILSHIQRGKVSQHRASALDTVAALAGYFSLSMPSI